MKKGLITAVILLLLGFCSSYFFVKPILKIGADGFAPLNIKAAEREMLDATQWKKWWPKGETFTYKGASFLFETPLPGVSNFKMLYQNDTLPGSLFVADNKDGRSYILWRCELKTGNNPFTKWFKYIKARKVKNILTDLTNALSSHLTEKNVYGFIAQKTTVKDSVLITTKKVFNTYPSLNEIAAIEQKLLNYIQQNGVAPKNRPMLSVINDGEGKYNVIMAFSTDKFLPKTNEFEPKLVLKGGNILEAEFTGGPSATAKAFELFNTYKNDLQLSAPAIPYQLLVTDRLKETDTTKWVTKFYYPVF